MAKIVNLRTRRKQNVRDESRKAGQANAAKHGLSKAERSLSAALNDKQTRNLDGHRRDPDSSSPVSPPEPKDPV